MFTPTAHRNTGRRRRALEILVSAVVLATAAIAVPVARSTTPESAVRVWTIHYTSHDGVDRLGTVLLPAWYGPGDDPPLPVVISPHGRGSTGLSNAQFWG